MLEIDKVSVHFDALVALDGVSFDVEQGQLAALIGPNGAGKSTLFDVMNGVRRPTEGRVRVLGVDVTAGDPARVMRLGVSRTFQTIRLVAALTVRDNVLLGLHGRGWTSRRRARADADEVISFVGLEGYANRFPSELVYGERKRVEVARAIVNRPKLLLLDEPFSGLNATESLRMVELIGRVHSEGTGVLLVEHDMSVVMSLAERVIVLNFGRKLADGTSAEVRRNPAVIEAYLGSHE